MADPITLAQHLAIQEGFLSSEHGRGVAAIVGRIGRASAVIAQELAHAALRDRLGYVGSTNLTGDQIKKLDIWGHDTMVAALRATGACAAVVSEESPDPVEIEEARG